MLYLPTYEDEKYKRDNLIFTNVKLKKGYVYNIDLDEFIKFQFNPVSFEWERDINWGEHNWVGSDTGGDLQFLNLGPRLIELDLLFLSDPRAPIISYESDFDIMDSDNLVDFEAIKDTLEKWEQLVEGKGRPSVVMIMVGNNVFEGVIKKYSLKITEFFEDLSAKEAMVSLEFREWIQI